MMDEKNPYRQARQGHVPYDYDNEQKTPGQEAADESDPIDRSHESNLMDEDEDYEPAPDERRCLSKCERPRLKA